MRQSRPLTSTELAVIERLLSADFRDVEYFRAQVPALTVTEVCDCGCGSLTFEVNADRAIRAPSRFWREGSQVLVEGDRRSWLMLFQHDGWLSELEHVAGHGPNPNDLDASRITPDVQVEESWFDSASPASGPVSRRLVMVEATADVGLPTGPDRCEQSSMTHPPLPSGAATGAADVLGVERDVGACLAFLEGEGLVDWHDIGPAHLRRFLAAESERRPAASSQARTVAALKGFFRFLVENEAIERNPALVLRTPKSARRCPMCSTSANCSVYSAPSTKPTCGNASILGNASAIGCCSHSSLTPAHAGPGCSGSTGTTSISGDG